MDLNYLSCKFELILCFILFYSFIGRSKVVVAVAVEVYLLVCGY